MKIGLKNIEMDWLDKVIDGMEIFCAIYLIMMIICLIGYQLIKIIM